MQLPPLGLYIHLPWCERKCPYCDFNSHESQCIPEQAYISRLLQDLQQDLPLVEGRSIDTLFIGGGTPSLFSASAIQHLLQGIAECTALSPTLEATLEANPGSAEAQKFHGFKAAGINRLSLGIQSFDSDCLRALGRVHNSDQAHAAIEFAQAAGFDSFNIDLMHGLPGQSAAGAEADLRTALGYRPPHLSWYQLTIEPNTVFHKRPPVLPLEDALADIQFQGEDLLTQSGYPQYEVSAFSKRGYNCRHNLNYWSFGDYIGIGAGAHSKISFSSGRIQRRAKKRQPDEYLAAAPDQVTATARDLLPEEIAGEFMLNALRLNTGFTPDEFHARTGLDIMGLKPTLESLYQRDLLSLENGHIRTTDTGSRFLDSVVGEFFD